MGTRVELTEKLKRKTGASSTTSKGIKCMFKRAPDETVNEYGGEGAKATARNGKGKNKKENQEKVARKSSKKKPR